MNSGLSPADPALVAAFRSARRLAAAGWAKVQVIDVPIEYGSSS